MIKPFGVGSGAGATVVIIERQHLIIQTYGSGMVKLSKEELWAIMQEPTAHLCQNCQNGKTPGAGYWGACQWSRHCFHEKDRPYWVWDGETK